MAVPVGPWEAQPDVEVTPAVGAVGNLNIHLNLNQQPGRQLNFARDEFGRIILRCEGQQVILHQQDFPSFREAQAARGRSKIMK